MTESKISLGRRPYCTGRVESVISGKDGPGHSWPPPKHLAMQRDGDAAALEKLTESQKLH